MKNITTEPTPTISPVPAMNQNLEVTTENGRIVIKLPMNVTPTPSATGKSLTVASTHGNIATTVIVDGKPVTVGVNCYIRR